MQDFHILTWDLCGARNDFLELDPINPNGGVDTR